MFKLRQTATNGKAVPIRYRQVVAGSYISILRREGLKVRTRKCPDGTFVAWCERIEAAP